MSRRLYATWRSATTFLQGCPAGRSIWGLTEASASRAEQPTLERAQRRFLFSTLEGSAEQADVKTRDEGLVHSFIKSYFAANKKYPSIALVVRETGEARKVVKDILVALKSGGNALPFEGAYMEGPSIMEGSSLHAMPLDEVYMEGSGDIASGDATYSASESLWSEFTRHDVVDKFGPLAPTLHAVASEEASVEHLGNMEGSASGDAMNPANPANEFHWSEDFSRHGVVDKFESLASTLQEMASEKAYMKGSYTNNSDSAAKQFRVKSSFQRDPLVECVASPEALFPTNGKVGDTSDQNFLELLEQVNSKENAIKKTAPLIEVLQQVASGSRRVHLSALGGAKNDLSWSNTLRSIMPSLTDKKQQNVSDDSASCTPASSAISKKGAASTQTPTLLTSREIKQDAASTRTPSLSTSREIKKDSHATCEVQYGVKLISTKRQTVLNQFSSPNLVTELKGISQVFSDLQENIRRVNSKHVSIHAILYFKTYEGMMDALNLKTLKIRGETLFLERETVVSAKDKLAEDLGAGSLFSKDDVPIESSPEGLQVSHFSAEGETLSSLADDANQSHLLWCPDFLRNTITIEEYPIEIPLKSIHNFFSVFGALQIFYGKGAIFITFENECDKRKALKVHQFVVDGFRFQIRTYISPNELVIRLVTDDPIADRKKAKNVCSKYGFVTHFQYLYSGTLLAHYADSEMGRAKEILSSLRRDQDLKGLWKPSLVYEGFRSCSKNTIDEDLKRLLDMSRRLLSEVEKLYSVHHTGCS